MSSTPYMPLWVGDYLSDTQHLSAAEHGAYLMLIMAYWQRGKPLPDGPRLAFIARLSPDEWAAAEPVLREFFDVRDGFWHHKRIDEELAKAAERSKKARKAGKASGELRANSELTPSSLQAELGGNHPNPNQVSKLTTPTVEQEVPREGKCEEIDDLGLGGVEAARCEPSVEAKRRVASKLGIFDPDPLARHFVDWQARKPPRQRARDPDALFVASAGTLWKNAPGDVRAACQPTTDRPPGIVVTPAIASPQLAALMAKQRGRHAH